MGGLSPRELADTFGIGSVAPQMASLGQSVHEEKTMRLMLSFAALFLAVVFLQLSSGAVAPLDALSGLVLGYTNAEIGLLGSAHFAGFLLGCWWAPRIMGSVGHSRAFAAFTGMGIIGILGHVLVIDALAWTVFRVAQGICIAGCFTVLEAWLQAKVTNRNRGRVMGSYRVADQGAQLVAQLMIGVLEPGHYTAYTILALFCAGALFPLTLTTVKQPKVPAAPALRPLLAWSLSPLAVAGTLVAALSAASFRMVGPVYGTAVGLETGDIALFLAAFIAGGAVAQGPVGWLADRYDRRWVLIWTSVAAIASCGITVVASDVPTWGIMATAALFGLTTFPIFSVAAAHAHDFATTEQRVELSAALMFWFAVGAIAAPLSASLLIDAFGPPALFAMIAVGHAGLVVFGLIRMRARPTATRTRFIFAPRTSFIIGRLTGQKRDEKKD
jgi:MFS family permease